MYKYLLILFSFLLMHLPMNASEEEVYEDTISVVNYDKKKVASYQKNSKYNYEAQLKVPEEGIWDAISRWLSKHLSRAFGSKFARNYTEPIMIGIFVLIVLLVIFFIVRKRPELFIRDKKEVIPHQLEEETIYDVNFEQQIQNSLQNGDFKLAIRLTYLQTLRYLQDNGHINWQMSKTPTEYTYEMNKAASKTHFRYLTNHFLRVRYGNFDADRSTYEEVRELQALIQKGGRNEK